VLSTRMRRVPSRFFNRSRRSRHFRTSVHPRRDGWRIKGRCTIPDSRSDSHDVRITREERARHG